MAPFSMASMAFRKASLSSVTPSLLAPNSITFNFTGTSGIGSSPMWYPAKEKSGRRLFGSQSSPDSPQSLEYSPSPPLLRWTSMGNGKGLGVGVGTGVEVGVGVAVEVGVNIGVGIGVGIGVAVGVGVGVGTGVDVGVVIGLEVGKTVGVGDGGGVAVGLSVAMGLNVGAGVDSEMGWWSVREGHRR